MGGLSCLPTWCKVGTGVYTVGLGWDCIHILILILSPNSDSDFDSVTNTDFDSDSVTDFDSDSVTLFWFWF